MEATLIQLAITNGPYVIILGIIFFWSKSLIQFTFSRDIEEKKSELSKKEEDYKATLARENQNFTHQLNQNLEAHKNKLDLMKQESQIQFSHLHLERAGVIRDLYAHLVELHGAMVDFTRTMHWVKEDVDKEESARVDRFNQAFSTFKNFYLPKKLYLDKGIAAQLDEILEKYWSEAYDFDLAKRMLKMGRDTKESYTIQMDKLNAISERVVKDFPLIISQIEDEFRKILGAKV
ncbi:hypothetical protein [Pedobacter sp.]|uniref:hypothetical protein n=1 Tax=Pedobacter sp. TaxID=1411316 RepID=UPI003BA84467